jgi:ATP-binding cassette subfamily B (MDR/TAP) protein 1
MALVILSVIPLISLCAAMMYISTDKYNKQELKAYEDAGQTAQSCLSSIRTVTAFNLQNKFIDIYEKYMAKVNKATRRKGLFFGIFGGSTEPLFISLYGIGILYSINLIQNESSSFSYSHVFISLFSATQSFTA